MKSSTNPARLAGLRTPYNRAAALPALRNPLEKRIGDDDQAIVALANEPMRLD